MYKRFFVHCLFPLLVGFIIYLFFHKPNLLLHKWANAFMSQPNYYNNIKNNKLSLFFLNHVLDIIWAYSLTWFLFLFINFNLKKFAKAAIVILIVSSTEVIQLFLSPHLTFDWVDLIFCICTTTLVLILYTHEIKIIA